MAIVSPAILAASERDYHRQLEKVAGLTPRIQIDLTDGRFAKAPTVRPEQAWWPVGVRADFHLMYEYPLAAVKVILEHMAHLIIVHAEAHGNFDEVADFCHAVRVKVGVALLPATNPELIFPALERIDHVLIFSGDLGSFGGHSDLTLLHKIGTLKERKPSLEFGWDGGINDGNIRALIRGGVDVLNVGGYIQNAPEPAAALKRLQELAAAS